MARGEQLGRQWKIIQTMISSRFGKSAADLADELEIHSRTVYRDLEALQLAGFPVYTEKKDGKKLWAILDAVKHQPPIPLSLTELMALYFSRDMLKVLRDTVFYDSIQSFFQKIRATLPKESLDYLDRMEKNFQIGQRPYKESKEISERIRVVNEAVLENHVISIIYHALSKKEDTKRKIAPYTVWFFDGTFYLIGFCHMRKQIRLFAIDRIKSIEITNEVFQTPDDFDARDYMRSSFGVFHGEKVGVKILFTEEAAGYIKEKKWHESQVIHDKKDGSIIFEAEVAGTDEIKMWVLRWGSKAQVLEPESLRDEILVEARQMIEKYKK